MQASVTELLLNVKKIMFWNTFNGIYTTLKITIMVHVKKHANIMALLCNLVHVVQYIMHYCCIILLHFNRLLVKAYLKIHLTFVLKKIKP